MLSFHLFHSQREQLNPFTFSKQRENTKCVVGFRRRPIKPDLEVLTVSFLRPFLKCIHSLSVSPSQAWSIWSPAQNRDSKQNITVSKQAQLQRTLNKDGGGKDAVTVCLWLGWLEALAMNGGTLNPLHRRRWHPSSAFEFRLQIVQIEEEDGRLDRHLDDGFPFHSPRRVYNFMVSFAVFLICRA